MNTEMIAVYTLVAAVVILPYIAFLIFGAGDTKQLNRNFNSELKANQLNLTEQERWNRHIIGLDEQQHKVLFLQIRAKNSVETELIDLTEVHDLHLIIKRNQHRTSQGHRDLLIYTGIDFEMHDHSIKRICFYDSELDINQNYEETHAEKWFNHIALAFKKSSKNRSKAA